MMIDNQIEALAVDTRRQVYTMLLQRPRSVQELADDLPVSRPAVSQHLKVLVEAGLATASSVGTRRVYSADTAGIAHLRDWADGLWTMAMGRFAEMTNREKESDVTTQELILEPVVKTLRLGLSAAEAFEAFTGRLGAWWPLASHSVEGMEAVMAHMEPQIGGRIVETTSEGAEHEWGRILTWEPGRRVEFSWYPGLPQDQQTHVEVQFRDAPGGSEMILIHTGWEIRGEQASQVRESYHTGWDLVLASFEDILN